MFSLMLAAASLTPAFGDTSYDDLGYVNREEGDCIARFDRGSIEIRQAFNEVDRTLTLVVVVTGEVGVVAGQPTPALPVGTKLWVRSSYGPAWPALVIESSPQRFRLVAPGRFVGDLMVGDSLIMTLHERLDAVALRDWISLNVGSDISDYRGKLAAALDCSDGLGL